jgi:hypothetical protein
MRDHPGCKTGEWKDSHIPLDINGKPIKDTGAKKGRSPRKSTKGKGAK